MTSLTPEQIEELDSFVFKVSMDGFTYALENYYPEKLPPEMLKKLSEKGGRKFLEKLMEEYGLQYS